MESFVKRHTVLCAVVIAIAFPLWPIFLFGIFAYIILKLLTED